MMFDLQTDADVQQGIIDVFRTIDKDGSGYIDAEEIQALMRKFGNPISLDDAKRMVKEADLDDDKLISYVELVAMTGALSREEAESMPHTKEVGKRIPHSQPNTAS